MNRFATDADILALKPLLYADTTPEQRAFALTETQCMFSVKKWGCHLLRGHLAYVCHTLKSDNAGSATTGTGAVAGEITGMSEGPISVSFGSGSSAGEKDSWLQTTPEGKLYVSLRRIVGAACGIPLRGNRVSCRPRRRCRTG